MSSKKRDLNHNEVMVADKDVKKTGDDAPPLDHTSVEILDASDHIGPTRKSSQKNLVTLNQEEEDDEDEMNVCCLETKTFKFFVSMATGFLFGIAMEKGRGMFCFDFVFVFVLFFCGVWLLHPR